MKKKAGAARGFIIGLIVFILIGGGLGYIAWREKWSARDSLAKEIDGFSPRQGVPSSIDGLRQAIAHYEKRIEAHVKDAAQTGNYWKILGTRFRDKGMHVEALQAYQKAVLYNTDDAVLHYLIGVSAASAAKAAYGQDGYEAAVLYETAERGYNTAIALQEGYTQALYALAVLYVFELERPQDAVPLFENYRKYNSADVDGLFVLARAYFMTENYEQAAAVYDEIMGKSKDKAKKEEAAYNKEYVMRTWRG
jgi:tetratricopeptide (TPR) repeat protein